jgi:type II secretory pathway component PulF
MKRKQKMQTYQLLFAVLLVLGLGTVVVPEITLAVDAAEWLVNFQTFFVDINTILSDNVAVIPVVAGIIALAYYFFVYRPKR